MPRVARFAGVNKKCGDQSSTQALLPLTDAPLSTQVSLEAPIATQTQLQSRQCTRYWTVDVKGNLSVYHMFLSNLMF